MFLNTFKGRKVLQVCYIDANEKSELTSMVQQHTRLFGASEQKSLFSLYSIKQWI